MLNRGEVGEESECGHYNLIKRIFRNCVSDAHLIT